MDIYFFQNKQCVLHSKCKIILQLPPVSLSVKVIYCIYIKLHFVHLVLTIRWFYKKKSWFHFAFDGNMMFFPPKSQEKCDISILLINSLTGADCILIGSGALQSSAGPAPLSPDSEHKKDMYPGSVTRQLLS